GGRQGRRAVPSPRRARLPPARTGAPGSRSRRQPSRRDRKAGGMNERSVASVWPVAQRPAREQRRGRYLPESAAHPGKMLPALARHAIEAFSAPGELVLDPMSGIGTTLVEAVHLGRRAVGVELEARWAALAAQNVCLAREHGAHG